MKTTAQTTQVRLIHIGNFIGVKLPKTMIEEYGFEDALVLEATDRGILLRKKDAQKVSWEATYKAMAKEREDWDDFEQTILDGLEGDDDDTETI